MPTWSDQLLNDLHMPAPAQAIRIASFGKGNYYASTTNPVIQDHDQPVLHHFWRQARLHRPALHLDASIAASYIRFPEMTLQYLPHHGIVVQHQMSS
jgi:hypothetical protein